MEKKIFIQSNHKQYAGALLAKYAIERFFKTGEKTQVEIINTDTLPLFARYKNMQYTMRTHEGKMVRTYAPDDLQTFTWSRFMPPELMGYEGRALVIDPDVFALVDVRPLFDMDMQGHAIAAVRRQSGAFKSSVMLLECAKLTRWKIADILERLARQTLDSKELISLEKEDVTELDPGWNSHDKITSETKMLHCTRKLTQPWKTGLPIDFMVEKPMPPVLGFIPRRPLLKLFRGYRTPTRYAPHPNPDVESFFFVLAKAALAEGALTRAFVEEEMKKGNLRADFLQKIEQTLTMQ